MQTFSLSITDRSLVGSGCFSSLYWGGIGHDCMRKEQLGRGSVGLANSQRHFWGNEKQETLEVSLLQKISDGQFGENIPGHP